TKANMRVAQVFFETDGDGLAEANFKDTVSFITSTHAAARRLVLRLQSDFGVRGGKELFNNRRQGWRKLSFR
ncbi:MAG: hypothetical protein JWM16_1181, partial [Verrucomicrobiales bacterium]|nr:hypothetical protein [Verrucomicrobiales bacterium]